MEHHRIPRWILATALAILSPLALFYLFVLPALIASGTMEVTPASVAFASFLFFQFWLITAEYTFTSAAQIYGFRRKHLLPVPGMLRLLPVGPVDGARTPGPIVSCILSYCFTVYGFAIAYTFISHNNTQAFTTGPLSLFDSAYFSLITAATIGYGDIAPVSRLARVFVMAEVAVTFMYAIFLLSMLGGSLRERP